MSFFCTAELCEEPGLALRATSLREKCFIKVSKGLLKLLGCFEEKLSQFCWLCRTQRSSRARQGHSPSSDAPWVQAAPTPDNYSCCRKGFASREEGVTQRRSGEK